MNTQASGNSSALREMLAISPYNQLALKPLAHADRVRLFDTTLRDGEQAPGIALSAADKVRIAAALDDLGVDMMEAGFAASSEIEQDVLKQVMDMGPKAQVYSLSRSVKSDVDAVLKTGVPYIHTFIATSPLHMQYKLKMTPEQVKEKAVSTIEYARDHGLEVMFSCEDATRSDLDFMKEICVAAQEAGASSINLPDTVGVIVPQGMAYIVSEMRKVLKVPISMHCHNDMGLAVANTLAGVEAGAEICHVTMSGIGERTGNAALEEVAVNLFANYGIEAISLQKIGPVSKLVERITGFPIAYNKPVIGRNAFAHESGIHVHGVMANTLTYEPFKPEMVGEERHIVIGKHSGEHSVRGRLEALGIRMPEEHMPELMAAIKEAAIGDKEIDDAELGALADNVLYQSRHDKPAVDIDGVAVMTGKGITSTATVNLRVNGDKRTAADVGVGPVDAAMKAIADAVGGQYTLEEYKLAAINGKASSLCEVTVMVRNSEREGTGLVVGKAVGTDVVQTSIDAMIAAINRDFSRYDRHDDQ